MIRRTPVLTLALCLTAYTAHAQPTVRIDETRAGDLVTATVTAHGFNGISGVNLSLLFNNNDAGISTVTFDPRLSYQPLGATVQNGPAIGLWALTPYPHPTVNDQNIIIATIVIDAPCGANLRWHPAAGVSYVQGEALAIVPNVTFSGPCEGDFNSSGTVDVQDVFDFLGAWFAHSCPVQSLFDFLSAWFGGCP